MIDDVECPYCKENLEINHDDGRGYEQDRVHEQQCKHCYKTFTYTTSVIFYYTAEKAPCLNEGDGDHDWKQTRTFPKEQSRMNCSYCDEERQPTEEEWAIILADKK